MHYYGYGLINNKWINFNKFISEACAGLSLQDSKNKPTEDNNIFNSNRFINIKYIKLSGNKT